MVGDRVGKEGHLIAGCGPLSHLCGGVNVLRGGLRVAIGIFKAEFVLQILICRERYWDENEPGRG